MSPLDASVLYGGPKLPQTHGRVAISDLTTTDLGAFQGLAVFLSEKAKSGAVLIGFDPADTGAVMYR